MKWHLLSISLTLFRTKKDYLWKRKTLVEYGEELFSGIILHFFGPERQIYEKRLMYFSFCPFFSNSLHMKRIGFSLLLDLLEHKIVTNLSIMERSSFIIARLVKSLNSDGFTWRVELIKHMLPSSRLLKNKEVLVSND